MENYAIKPTSISKKYHVMYINKRGKKHPRSPASLTSIKLTDALLLNQSSLR